MIFNAFNLIPACCVAALACALGWEKLADVGHPIALVVAMVVAGGCVAILSYKPYPKAY